MTPQTAYTLGAIASIAPTTLLIWAAHDVFRLLREHRKNRLRADAERAAMREGLRREWLIVEAEHLERQRQELAAELSAAPANQARAAIKPALTEATHKALRMATGRGA